MKKTLYSIKLLALIILNCTKSPSKLNCVTTHFDVYFHTT